MTFQWKESYMPLFLDLYREQECLWNIRHPSYRKLTIRKNSYITILRKLPFPSIQLSDVKSKIKSIRAEYSLEYARKKKAEMFGDNYCPRIAWFQQADEFLRDSICAKNGSQSSLQNDDDAKEKPTEFIAAKASGSKAPAAKDAVSIPKDSANRALSNKAAANKAPSPALKPLSTKSSPAKASPISTPDVEAQEAEEEEEEEPEAVDECIEIIDNDNENMSQTASGRNSIDSVATDLSVKPILASRRERRIESSVITCNTNYVNPKERRKQQMCCDCENNYDGQNNDNCCVPQLNEFDVFCNSLAIQLKKMPLRNALKCQAQLLNVVTQHRLYLMCDEADFDVSPQQQIAKNCIVSQILTGKTRRSP